MFNYMKAFNQNQQGSVFIETAFLIIGIVFAVAPLIFSLGETLGNKVQEIQAEVEQVGI
ncbi:MAG: hypothetical protein HGA27_08550 [Peptococcaceae bacterium]|nr:hypothetical protein [Peptococcaceae bacterium]